MDALTTILELVGLLFLVAAIILIGIGSLIAGLLLAGVLCLFLSWTISRRAVRTP